MSGLLSTVFSTAKPPIWSDCIVLEVEDLDGILNKGQTYRCIPLVIQGPCPKDKLTWAVMVGTDANCNLCVNIEVSISGFTEMKCETVTQMNRGGLKYSGEAHQFEADCPVKLFQEVLLRDHCYVVPGKVLKGGLLRINILITVCFAEPTIIYPDPSVQLPDFDLLLGEELGDCGSDLFRNPVLSDVVIKCGDSIFPAHKMILALRSPVFARMFESQMKESPDCKIIIDDVTAATCEGMLKYFYTGKMTRNDCMDPKELLYCADKYDIQALKNVSIRIMKSTLSDENAGEFNAVVQKCCVDEASKSFFRKYCQERHSILIEKDGYKKIFLQNVELFV
ncbi:unnamed protein product [Allacma fusca]|uniref:BTB domain-containing protein n=1 Tax=Allacma fusca TaxID=39272 RepID=A0A8J2P2X8_9HEXA|nr:unnamed protein product [Allacma fusca]